MQRACAVCEIKFTTKSSRLKTCSMACTVEHRSSVRAELIASDPEKYREQRRAQRVKQRELNIQAYREMKNGWNNSWRAKNIEKLREQARLRARKRLAILRAAEKLGLLHKGEVFL